jgi:hypothetical protein
MRGLLTIGIILSKPTPESIDLDSRGLHKYGIASEHDCSVRPKLGTLVAIRNPARSGVGLHPNSIVILGYSISRKPGAQPDSPPKETRLECGQRYLLRLRRFFQRTVGSIIEINNRSQARVQLLNFSPHKMNGLLFQTNPFRSWRSICGLV